MELSSESIASGLLLRLSLVRDGLGETWDEPWGEMLETPLKTELVWCLKLLSLLGLISSGEGDGDGDPERGFIFCL